MALNGFFPAAGVVASLANNARAAVNAAASGCAVLYYGRGKCRQQVDFDALNGIMSQLLCIIETTGRGYDCADLCQVAKSIPDLVERCFTSLSLTTVPDHLIVPFLIDDTVAGVTANGGVAALYGWNCHVGAYIMLNPQSTAASAVRCFSSFTPGLTAPPSNFVGMILLDDRSSPPIVWYWNCTAGAYQSAGGSSVRQLISVCDVAAQTTPPDTQLWGWRRTGGTTGTGGGIVLTKGSMAFGLTPWGGINCSESIITHEITVSNFVVNSITHVGSCDITFDHAMPNADYKPVLFCGAVDSDNSFDDFIHALAPPTMYTISAKTVNGFHVAWGSQGYPLNGVAIYS